MIRLPLLLFVFLYLAHLVQGATSSSCPAPPPDGIFRSVWSILGSCGLTLLICVWQAIRPDVPRHLQKWRKTLLQRASFVSLAIFIPEWIVGTAAREWWQARRKVIQFRGMFYFTVDTAISHSSRQISSEPDFSEKKYDWSMTHSYFAEMGGFVHTENEGDWKTIDSLKFLDLCEEKQIANPVITVEEIKARSKSDALGKAIFALQLSWFMLQVVVRGSRGLAVTLVELDTVCIVILMLLLLVLWWDKPLRPEYPHIFYSPQGIRPYPQTVSAVSKTWKSEPNYLYTLMTRYVCIRKTQLMTGVEEAPLVGTNDNAVHSRTGELTTMIGEMVGDDVRRVSFFATWLILGILHLIAWNFDFPTETEKIVWRVASLCLVGAPVAVMVGAGAILTFTSVGWYEGDAKKDMGVVLLCAFPFGVVSRVLLVVLMFASLRALPCSAHQTTPWTIYIPHL